MRIIRGKYKTRYFPVPKGFPSRPTTDFAKEGLFNILEHQYLSEDMRILDLCAGTGSIGFEFLSRECGQVTAVDQNHLCVRHLLKMAEHFDCKANITAVKSEILRFLEQNGQAYDLIFADPPFDFKAYETLIQLVFQGDWLAENGVLIIEHGKETSLEHITHFQFMRIYGNVRFSFFEITVEE